MTDIDNTTEALPGIPQAIVADVAEWDGTAEAQAALVAAWAKASVDFEEIGRDAQGQIGNRYFKYAPLVNLTKATRKVLGRQGIVCMQALTTSPRPAHPEHGAYHRLTTEVCGHGAKRRSAIDFLPARVPNAERSDRDSPQVTNLKEYGKQTTYLRRYAYQCMFVLDGEPDADEAGAQVPEQPRGNAAPKPATRKQETKPDSKREGLEKVAADLRAKGHAVTIREPEPTPDDHIEDQLRASANGHSETEPEEPQPDQDEPDMPGPITEAQKQALRALAIKLKMAGPVLAERCRKITGRGPLEMSAADAAKVISDLQGT